MRDPTPKKTARESIEKKLLSSRVNRLVTKVNDISSKIEELEEQQTLVLDILIKHGEMIRSVIEVQETTADSLQNLERLMATEGKKVHRQRHVKSDCAIVTHERSAIDERDIKPEEGSDNEKE